MTNLENILNLDKLLKSKKIMQKYWQEQPFGYNILINDNFSFPVAIKLINDRQPRFQNQLIPVMKISDGDDIICLYQSNFYIFQLYDVVSSSFVIFSTPEQVWQELIKPDIEEYYGIKIED